MKEDTIEEHFDFRLNGSFEVGIVIVIPKMKVMAMLCIVMNSKLKITATQIF